jgi:hypothetical protein
MRTAQRLGIFFLLAAALALHGCGAGGSFSVSTSGRGTGTVFVVGTDAPLASVLAFRVTLTALSASDGTNTVQLIAAPQEVEFARLNGLRTLLSMRDVPAGSYTTISATLASPVISFLNTQVTPPAVETLAGTLEQATVSATLPQPLVVTENGLVGLHLDLRLRDSIQVDGNGQVTGVVRPRIFLRAIPPDAPDAVIDELRGGVVSVNAAGGSFVMQVPNGITLTVTTDGQTMFEGGEGLATLDTNSVVAVSGSLQRQTRTLRATEVVVVSRDRFVFGGLLTHVRPDAGPADEVDLLVHTELPDVAGVQVGQITTVGFDGNEGFMIHHLRVPFAPFLFNRASLVAGQRVAIGGAVSGNVLDARRVVLLHQGLDGNWIPGSTVGGSFAINAAGLTGIVFGHPVRVFTSEHTRFIGLTGVGDLAGTSPIRLRVVGLVLEDDVTGRPIVAARAVERLQ